MTMEGSRRPVACDPAAIPAERRAAHAARRAGLAARVRVIRREAGAILMRFPIDAAADLVAFAADERRCCPFLRFDVIPAAGAGSIALEVSGTRAGLRVFEQAFHNREDSDEPVREGG